MKSLIPWRSKKTELAGRGEQLFPFFPFFPFGDFPFSLSRMRDEFDRFFDEVTALDLKTLRF